MGGMSPDQSGTCAESGLPKTWIVLGLVVSLFIVVMAVGLLRFDTRIRHLERFQHDARFDTRIRHLERFQHDARFDSRIRDLERFQHDARHSPEFMHGTPWHATHMQYLDSRLAKVHSDAGLLVQNYIAAHQERELTMRQVDEKLEELMKIIGRTIRDYVDRARADWATSTSPPSTPTVAQRVEEPTAAKSRHEYKEPITAFSSPRTLPRINTRDDLRSPRSPIRSLVDQARATAQAGGLASPPRTMADWDKQRSNDYHHQHDQRVRRVVCPDMGRAPVRG